MYAQCPHCGTLFRLRAAQLKAAHGIVRCSRCLTTFDSLDSLLEEPKAEAHTDDAVPTPEPEPTPPSERNETLGEDPESEQGAAAEILHGEEEGPAAAGEFADEPAADTESAELPTAEPRDFDAGIQPAQDLLSVFLEFEQQEKRADAQPGESESGEADEALPSAEPAESYEPPADGEPMPTTEPKPDPAWETTPAQTGMEQIDETLPDGATILSEPAPMETPAATELPFEEAASSYRFALPWTFGVLGLLLALALQASYFQREALARYPGARPYVVRLCELTGCELPPRRAPGQIRVEHRDVRVHPTAPHALLIALRMVNVAAFDQPYPALELMLLNIDGEAVAKRRFRPDEYLSADPEYPEIMPTGVPIHVQMGLVDPGAETTGFEFRFH